MAKFEIGVHALVFDDRGRILLGHRQDMDLWDLPGGGLEHGELPIEGVVREVKEETGLEVEVERLFIIGVAERELLGFVFSCRPTGGSLKMSDETDAVQFFKLNELPEMISPRKRAIIEASFPPSQEIQYVHVIEAADQVWYASQLNMGKG